MGCDMGENKIVITPDDIAITRRELLECYVIADSVAQHLYGALCKIADIGMDGGEIYRVKVELPVPDIMVMAYGRKIYKTVYVVPNSTEVIVKDAAV